MSAVSCQQALWRGGLRATFGACGRSLRTVEGRIARKGLQGVGTTLVLRMVPSPEGTARWGQGSKSWAHV